MTVFPTVIDGFITQMHLDDLLLPLRTSIPIDQLDELLALVEKFDQYFDLTTSVTTPTNGSLAYSWNEHHFLRVVKVNYSNKIFLSILCNHDEPTTLVEIAEAGKVGYELIRGAVTSIARYALTRKLPPLFIKESKMVQRPNGDGSHRVHTYLLREKYRTGLCSVLQKIVGPGQRRKDQ